MPKKKKPVKRKAYKRRKSSGVKLKKNTVYTLTAVALIFAAAACVLSYTKSGTALIKIN